MRICVVGKFPPIQGGVSSRTYWTAHALAARGHEVHVVTNAKEAGPPFRIHMRRKDWKRCEAVSASTQGGAASGSVTVHWTDPLDNSQFYIPLASAFVSKLAGTAARVHAERPFDVVYSHYLEPYGIAGHLAAEIARVPHIVRLAGSDAGRLWRHQQLEALYDHVLRSAATVIASGSVATRATQRGVQAERIAAVGAFELPNDLFCPEGPTLDLAALRQEIELDEPELREAFWGEFTGDLPFFGIYGKLGETKGSFALLSAMQRLKQQGVKVALVAMAHGWPALEGKFRARAEELGIADRVLQIPFLPHWRVPEFLRSCLAVCCLEQDFPIIFHSPIVAREVLACGRCLIGSTEVIRKLPDHERLPDGYGCVAIEDVQDVDALSARLAALAEDPEPIATVGRRGHAFIQALEADVDPQDQLDLLLEAAVRMPRSAKKAASGTGQPAADATPDAADDPRFPITSSLARTLAGPLRTPIELPQARDILTIAEGKIASGDNSLRAVATAVRLEIAIAEAELTEPTAPVGDLLFRLHTKRWAAADRDLPGLVPVHDPRACLMTFDASALSDDASGASRAAARPHLRHVVAFSQTNGERREPLFLSDQAARILHLSDGTRTAMEIARQLGSDHERADLLGELRQIEDLFVAGLLGLRDAGFSQPLPDPAEATRWA